jgi:hypothetical protein
MTAPLNGEAAPVIVIKHVEDTTGVDWAKMRKQAPDAQTTDLANAPTQVDPAPAYEVHALCAVWPTMAEEQFAALVADIAAAKRLRDPILLYDGQVLDGAHRLRACLKAGVPPRFEDWHPAMGNPRDLVISRNMARRHLTESQRAWVAAEIADMKQGARTDLAQKCATSQGAAGELLGVSRRSVQAAKKVKDRGAPELIDAVKQSRLKVSAAAKIADRPRAEQSAIVKERVAQKRAPKRADSKDKGKRKSAAVRREEAIWRDLDLALQKFAFLSAQYSFHAVVAVARKQPNINRRVETATKFCEALWPAVNVTHRKPKKA